MFPFLNVYFRKICNQLEWLLVLSISLDVAPKKLDFHLEAQLIKMFCRRASADGSCVCSKVLYDPSLN